MKILLLLKAVILSIVIQGQTQISGRVIDATNNLALSFVNIGIKNENVGTVSSDLGAFEIQIPAKNLNDTLTFSIVGFRELNIVISQIISDKRGVFALEAKALQLEQVNIVVNKLVERKYGIKKKNPAIRFVDASINQTDIFEIAQVIELPSTPSKLTSLNLLISGSNADSGTFRINFYDFDGNIPTNRLTGVNITERKTITPGWLKFDLRKYDIYLQGSVTAAIEFIPGNNGDPIYYQVKLGGSSRSFVRSSSLGKWNTPPHHYRMFVTALAAENQSKPDVDTEEAETKPQFRLFSRHVEDTFSLFVSLPKSYNKSKVKHPVILLLDANVYFDHLSSKSRRHNQGNKIIEPIIVGIGYDNFIACDSLRNRDYTFPIALPKDSFPISGGADKFLTFLENEVMPFVDANYRTDTINRTLMGHSLGGYFTLFALHQHQKRRMRFFKYYVSASPSLGYCNQFIYHEFKKLLEDFPDTNKRDLLMTAGSFEDGDDGGSYFNSLTTLLANDVFKNITVIDSVYLRTDHMGTAIPTFEQGLDRVIAR